MSKAPGRSPARSFEDRAAVAPSQLVSVMQRKVAVSGDVSQLVTGNVVHEAPATVHQQNNHVVYNISKSGEPEYLHWHQRRAISARVDEVAQAEGMDRLAVYRVILDHHDARSMKTMPAHRYRAIMDDLAVWLQEAKSRQPAEVDSPNSTGGAQPDRASPVAPSPAAHAAPKKRRINAHALHWTLSLLAFSACGFLIWKHVEMQGQTPPGACHFDGKVFSVGSIAAMPPQGLYECAAGHDPAAAPHWTATRNPSSSSKRRFPVDPQRSAAVLQ